MPLHHFHTKFDLAMEAGRVRRTESGSWALCGVVATVSGLAAQMPASPPTVVVGDTVRVVVEGKATMGTLIAIDGGMIVIDPALGAQRACVRFETCGAAGITYAVTALQSLHVRHGLERDPAGVVKGAGLGLAASATLVVAAYFLGNSVERGGAVSSLGVRLVVPAVIVGGLVGLSWTRPRWLEALAPG